MTARVNLPNATWLLVIGSLNLWLIASIGAQLAFEASPLDKEQWTPGIQEATGEVPSRKPIDTFRQTLARPVFFKTRQPFVAPSVAAPAKQSAPPATVPTFVLAGIMINADVKKVFISSGPGGPGIWASEGEEFGGWKVSSVNESGIKLEQNGRVIEISLYPKAKQN